MFERFVDLMFDDVFYVYYELCRQYVDDENVE